MKKAAAVRCAWALILLGSAARAQWSATEEALLQAQLGGLGGVGSAVEVQGDRCVVGYPRGSSGLSGRAMVYRRSAGSWTIEQTLQAADDLVGNLFGNALALDGDTLVVGARGTVVNGFGLAGAAYVFVRSGTTWTQQAKLVPSDPEQNAEFGYALTLDGDTCAVGAPQSTTNGTQYAGATYVFVRNGSSWTQQQRIVPNAPFSYIYGSRSGRAVALAGNSLLIGAPTSFDLASNTILAGRVFEWVRSGPSWSQVAELTPNDAPDGRQFGCSIGYDGSRAIIGAWSENDLPSGTSVGTAYVFRRAAGWQQEAELPRAGIDNGDNFGLSVDLDGARAVVGAQNAASSAGTSTGTLRVFEFDGATWGEKLALAGSATAVGDKLGTAVALDGTMLIAGAPAASVPGLSSGEAYVWRIGAGPHAYCTAKTNSLGCVPAVGWSGSASASSAAAFSVSATQVLNQKLGLAFYGFAPTAAPFQGGFLCVEPPTRRRVSTNSGGSPLGSDCSGSYSYEFNALIQSGSDPALTAGADLYVQFWYRDPASPSTTGLTNALHALIQP
ncbi:MAG: FG-GAP repeat protein [Planctomycetes bacterium]|nr:FG-GAP repeat protein [Planctomycetota bacterium]